MIDFGTHFSDLVPPPAANTAPKRGQAVPHSIENARDGFAFPHSGSHLPPRRPSEAIRFSFSLFFHALWDPLGSILLYFSCFVAIIFLFLTFASRASRPGTNYHWAEASVTTTRARWRGRGFAALKIQITNLVTVAGPPPLVTSACGNRGGPPSLVSLWFWSAPLPWLPMGPPRQATLPWLALGLVTVAGAPLLVTYGFCHRSLVVIYGFGHHGCPPPPPLAT